ncbi:MAG TPA: hypothetical protein VFB14_12625 [Bryobacteraceae bacterium]|jgi:hypothetical protein|nr:hypothetical protein [Bryobacteraceae bacterium]
MNISEITTLIASLLAEQRIPALDEGPYQEFTEYLFATAGSALRFEVAEVVIRHDRQHPRALGLFLACACPLAQKTARRMMEKSFSQPPDLTEELLYHGAIDGAIRMFQRDQIRDELPFRQALHHALKMGAIRSAFRRTENKGVSCMGSVDHHARTQRMEQQFIARDMLDKIAALEPEPQTARLNTFLRCLVALGPHIVVKPLTRNSKRGALIIDFEPVMKDLGISRWAARQYMSQARRMLVKQFNPDGALFIKGDPRKR